jgi:hypothetical protein
VALLNAIPTLKDNIWMAKTNLDDLLQDLCNKQFFMFFTPLPATGKTYELITELGMHTSYHIMKNENKSFLQWLVCQLVPLPQHNDRHGSHIAALLPFQEKLIVFLKTDWQSAKQHQACWKCMRGGSSLAPDASLARASLTEMAINALEQLHCGR